MFKSARLIWRKSQTLLCFMGFLLLCVLASRVDAANPSAFDEGSQLAKQRLPGITHASDTLEPQKFKGFTTHPAMADTDRDNPNLKSKAQAEAAESADAKAVENNFIHRPDVINPKSDGFIKSVTIQDNADDIVHNRYPDCKKEQKDCKTDYLQKTCTHKSGLGPMQCTSRLIATAYEHEPAEATVVVDAKVWDGDYNESAVYLIDLNTGQYKSGTFGGQSAQTTPLPEGQHYDCKKSSVKLLKILPEPGTNVTGSIDSLGLECARDKTDHVWLVFHFMSARGPRPVGAKLKLLVRGQPYPDIKTHWQTNCPSMPAWVKGGQCALKKIECTEGEATRMINHIPVSAPCWAKRVSYQCGDADDQCQPLRDQGCEWLHDKCISSDPDHCQQFEASYRCPIKRCEQSGIVCGGEFFCVDGDCTDHSVDPGKNFAKDISKVEAAEDASKHIDEKSQLIFGGGSMYCGDDDVGFSNCCKDSGWGHDTGLAHCNETEKKLGKAKEAGLVIAPPSNRICSKKVPFIGCVAHRKVYCVFQSKLAKIIQQQGRGSQLHIGFGDGESPNCRGISPEELSNIDFDKIDFKEFYDDIHPKAHDQSDIEKAIEKHIHDDMGGD